MTASSVSTPSTLPTEPCSPSLSLQPSMLGSGTLAMVSEQLEATSWLAGHNIAGDVTQLLAAGVHLREGWVRGDRVLDSLLLAKMADENEKRYGLEDVAVRELKIEPWKHRTKAFDKLQYRNANGRLCTRKDVDARRWPVPLRRDRCVTDAWASRLLSERFYEGSKRQLIQYTHRTAMTLERLWLAGAIVDLEVLDTLDRTYGLQREESRDRLVKLAGTLGMESFTPTNDNHLRELLYSRLALPVMGTTPTGMARVDKVTLEGLGDHEAIRHLLDYNRADKLYRVNIAGTRELVRDIPSSAAAHTGPGALSGAPRCGYLPFRINPLGARTGRRSSSNPNAQNWPEAARGMVTSRWPGGLILNADYKKLEVVLIAWIANEDKLLNFFTKGNGYVAVAKELFGYDVAEGTDNYRAIKAIVLGTHYNLQTPNMAKRLALLGITFSPDWAEHEKETGRLRKLYLRRFPGIPRYMERQRTRWEASGAARSFTGRIRHLPVETGSSSKEWWHLLSQAINFPVQGLAADVEASALMDAEAAFMAELGMGYAEYHRALIEQQKNMLTRGLDRGIILPVSQIFNEVHDDIVVDIHPDRVAKDTEIIVESMRAVRSLKELAPGFDASILDVDTKLHHHWKSK